MARLARLIRHVWACFGICRNTKPSVRELCVLCASVVDLSETLTTETQSTRSMHREGRALRVADQALLQHEVVSNHPRNFHCLIAEFSWREACAHGSLLSGGHQQRVTLDDFR